MRRIHTIALTLTGAVVLAVVAGPSLLAEPPNPAAGTTFRDCPECPEMVVVPAGSFTMGSPEGEVGRSIGEGPQHVVTISRNFAVGKFEVTFDEWDACVAAGGCGGHRPDDKGWGRGSQPVMNVSWDDAKQYVGWLSRRTGKTYRLLTEAEWEYAARAGTNTAYPWGDRASHEYANYGKDECCGGLALGRDQWVNTSPVGSFPANDFGLFDMHGNVREWVEDCWHNSYDGAPSDGRAWTVALGTARGYCSSRVLRGGSHYLGPGSLRSADHDGNDPGYRNFNFGFRVSRTQEQITLPVADVSSDRGDAALAVMLSFLIPAYYFSPMLNPVSEIMSIVSAFGIGCLALGVLTAVYKRQSQVAAFLISPAITHILVASVAAFQGRKPGEGVSDLLFYGFLAIQAVLAGYLIYRLRNARLAASLLAAFSMTYAVFAALVVKFFLGFAM